MREKHVISFLSYQFNEIFFSSKERDQLFYVLISVSCLFIFHLCLFLLSHSGLEDLAVSSLLRMLPMLYCSTTTITIISFYYPLISFSIVTCSSQMFPSSNISHTIICLAWDGWRSWWWCDITATLNDEKIQLYSLTCVNTLTCMHACVRACVRACARVCIFALICAHFSHSFPLFFSISLSVSLESISRRDILIKCRKSRLNRIYYKRL